MYKKFSLCFGLFLFWVALHGQNYEQEQEILSVSVHERALKKYAENDIGTQELRIRLQETLLQAEQKNIEVGPNVNFSTGDVQMTFGNEKKTLSFAPELMFSLPKANNLSLKAQAPSSVGFQKNEQPNYRLNNAGLSLQADIISSQKKQQNLEIEQVKRNIIIAERNLKKHTLTVEKKYWENIRSLYEIQNSVAETAYSLATKQKDFETTKARGLAPTSVQYRQTELAVKKAEHSHETAKRQMQEQFLEFSKKTDIILEEIPALLTLSADMQNTQPFSIFDEKVAVDVEEKQYTLTQNDKKRNINDDFSLSANFGSYFSGSPIKNEKDNEVNISTGLSMQYKALKINTGVSVPVLNKNDTTFKISLGWDFQQQKKEKLSDQQKNYAHQLDELALQSAKQNWQETKNQLFTKAEHLKQQVQEKKEEFELYAELYNDTEKWYNEGLLSYYEFLSVQAQYEQAQSAYYNSIIAIYIYNLETNMLLL